MFGGLLESLSLAQTVLVVVGTLLVSQLEDGPQPVHAGRRITSLIVVSIQRIRSLLESLSWFKPLLVSPPMVQTVGYVDQYSLPIPHSCRYCGTNAGFDFLLVSLTWFKPGERLSLAKPVDVSVSIR